MSNFEKKFLPFDYRFYSILSWNVCVPSVTSGHSRRGGFTRSLTQIGMLNIWNTRRSRAAASRRGEVVSMRKLLNSADSSLVPIIRYYWLEKQASKLRGLASSRIIWSEITIGRVNCSGGRRQVKLAEAGLLNWRWWWSEKNKFPRMPQV